MSLNRKNLVLLEKTSNPLERVMYGEDGRNLGVATPDNILQEMRRLNAYFYMSDLVKDGFTSFIEKMVFVKGCKILTSREQVPQLVRYAPGTSSHWIVSCKTWNVEPTVRSLVKLRDFFDELEDYGIGVSPTPSSVGLKTMILVYNYENVHSFYSPSYECEKFLLDNSTGGINKTSAVSDIPFMVSYGGLSDRKMCYLSESDELPYGTQIHFTDGCRIDHYATWFARCIITINNELVQGVFPFKLPNGELIYPHRPGVYNTAVWKETADMARHYGCDVKVLDGWGWPEFTHLNERWIEFCHSSILYARNEFVAKRLKRCYQAAIGRMGRGRDFWILKPGTEDQPFTKDSLPYIKDGAPRWDIRLVKDTSTDASMMHWNRYIVDQSNLSVIQFAMPYAEKGTLLMMSTDAVMAYEDGDDGEKRLVKYTGEAIESRPGSWLWALHTGVVFIGKGMWLSNEEPDRHGQNLVEYLKTEKRLYGLVSKAIERRSYHDRRKRA